MNDYGRFDPSYHAPQGKLYGEAAPAVLAALTAAESVLRTIPADQFDGHAAEALRLVSAALAAAR